MSSPQTAIVIGAGIGGIATAGLLARQGYQVTVLEKNAIPGGRCGQLIRDGHRFDTGPTLFLIPEVMSAAYAALGERIEDHLDLRRIDPTYRFHFDDGTQLDLTTDMHAMQPQMEAIEPGSFGGLLRYMVEGQRAYRLALDRLVIRNYANLLDYFNLRNLSLLFKLKGLVKHYHNTGKFFQHPYLRAAFSFQNLYLGMSPYDAPATYSLLQYTELVDGVWFPTGGMFRIVESLVSIAEKHGAHFEFNAPVKQIQVDGNRATGVILKDDTRLYADVIVANADLPYVYRHLLSDQTQADRLEQRELTCSAIMFYWGADRVHPQIGVHNLFMAGDYRKSFDRIFEDYSLPNEPNFYIHAPARVDPTAAPPGEDTLMVLVPCGRLHEANAQDWDALQTQARSAVLHRLAEIGVVDLDKHLKFEICYTPRNWQNLYNVIKGAAFGSISHGFTQVGYLRPQNRHRRYHNLFFAGGSTHPGNGLPLVLLSAQLTTERILEANGAPRTP